MKEINNHNGWSRSMFQNVLVRVFTDLYVLCLGCEEISVKGKNPTHRLSILAPEMYQQMWKRENIWPGENCDHFLILFFGESVETTLHNNCTVWEVTTTCSSKKNSPVFTFGGDTQRVCVSEKAFRAGQGGSTVKKRFYRRAHGNPIADYCFDYRI